MKNMFRQTSVGIMRIEEGKEDSFYRIADVDNEGILHLFKRDPNKSGSYENRSRVFLGSKSNKEQHPENGEIGIWEWEASTNMRDDSTDYTTGHLQSNLIPWEVIFIGRNDSLEKAKKILIKGITAVKSKTNKLFVFSTENPDSYKGLCCNVDQLKYADGKIKLNEEVEKIDYVVISSSDIKIIPRLQNRFLYKKLNGPEYREDILVQSKWKIALDIVRERCNWTLCKQKNLTRKEYQSLKSYIDNLPETDLYEEIAQRTYTNKGIAKQLVDEIINKMDSYFLQEDEEDSLLEILIENHEKLKLKYQKKVADDWALKSEKEINAAKLELKNIEEKKYQLDNTIRDILVEQENKKAELRQLQKEIESEKQEFETWKRTWIIENNLRLNHSEYTSIYEEIQKIIANTIHEKHSNKVKKEFGVQKNTSADHKVHFGKVISDNQLTALDTWEDEIQTVDCNMYELAISREYSEILATTLYWAFFIKKPILLVGPAAESICDGVSAALCQRTADSVYLQENAFEEIKQMCQESRDGIIRISNTINNEVLSETIRLSQDCHHQYYLTHPFIEDLSLLPKSLLNYFLIIDTEPFVEDMVVYPNFAGGQKSKTFTPFPLQMRKRKGSEFLKYGIPIVYANLLGNIIELFENEKNKESWAKFLLLGIEIPMFYMMGQKDFLQEAVENVQSLSSRERRFVENKLENMNG
ncbi:hypothetical protein SAMN05216495_1014 [Acidaminococcus fermentans]|uniref:Uncharacterized protein n=1 Tax=Acidaminococcus fermentans TaxID=905 RepID=A0A1H2STN9_ACIFE|nr:hypothetical protein [Acidaminococcus fermentans]SDW34992.1 hypothetical protein SAMN05216495_1014 [Acidaminococcus fermentans]